MSKPSKRKYCIGLRKKQYDHRANFTSKKEKLSQTSANVSQENNYEVEQTAKDDNKSTVNEKKSDFGDYGAMNLNFNEQLHATFHEPTNSNDVHQSKFVEASSREDMKLLSKIEVTENMCLQTTENICLEIDDTEQVWNLGARSNEAKIGGNIEKSMDLQQLIAAKFVAANSGEDMKLLSKIEVTENMCVGIADTEQVWSLGAGSNEAKIGRNIEKSMDLQQLIAAHQCEEEIFSFIYGNQERQTGECSTFPLVLNTKSNVKVGDVIDWNQYEQLKQVQLTESIEVQEGNEKYVETECDTDTESIAEVNSGGSESEDDNTSDVFKDYCSDWDGLSVDSDDNSDDDVDDSSTSFQNDSSCHQPQGNRIVDINFLISQIKEMNSHSVSCNFNDMNFVAGHEEFKQGFKSTFKFICSKCSFIYSMKTSAENDFMDINYASVVASYAIGIGQSQLEEFTAILGVPTMAHSTYESHQEKFLADIDGAARQSMDAVAKEETKLAIEKGSVDSKGRPVTKAYVDGAWNKRSYRTNYSASSGTATLIGYNTKKVMWNDVANKYCVICARIATKNLEPYEHKCNINYNGSSTGMEAKLIVKGFKECDERYGLRIDEIIADGDSSVISELNKAHIYKYPDSKIGKLDCCNHLFRNGRGSLRKLATNIKFAQFLTDAKIEDIIQGIRSARMHWIKTDLAQSEQIENLRQDILNAPLHVLGSHEKCAEYFCTKKGKNEMNVAKILKENNSFNKVQDALSRCRLNARSILIYENTNIVEHFNSYIVKHSGNKRINFSKSGSWKGRVQFGVLDHNTKRAYSTICEFINKSPQPLMERLEFNRMKRNLHELVKDRTYVKKRSGKSGPDGSYGTETREGPDLDDIEFELEKKMFLEYVEEFYIQHDRSNTVINKTDTELDSIDRMLLISSHFGSVCTAKSPTNYHGIVNEILYEESMTLKEIVHQSTYKSHAIRKFENLYRVKVNPGGMFIDQSFHTLAAIPEGLIGTNCIVMIKCPLSTFEIDVEQSILDGKLTIWKKERKRKNNPNFVPKVTGINTNHKWYFDIQGQLHITQRDWCYLVVWASDDLPLRVEKIQRDDHFWRDKMEMKLNKFYDKVLLLELVDSRSSRYMDLRKFDKNYVCVA